MPPTVGLEGVRSLSPSHRLHPSSVRAYPPAQGHHHYTQRSRLALEASELIARQFGIASATRLHNLGLELQLGLAETKPGQSHTELLVELPDLAAPWLDPKALNSFRHAWRLNDDHWGTAKTTSPPLKSESADEQTFTLRLFRHFIPSCTRMHQAQWFNAKGVVNSSSIFTSRNSIYLIQTMYCQF